jgi:hypothetical protein
MSKIKTFEEFSKEKAGSKVNDAEYSSDTKLFSKDINEESMCSSKIQEKMCEVYEMAMAEMKQLHEDDNDEHTAEAYMKEYMKEVSKCNKAFEAACEEFLGDPADDFEDKGKQKETPEKE